MSLMDKIQGGVIVSCQAKPGEPLYGAKYMSAFARCAELAGAVGIRANGPQDIRAIKKTVKIPLLGIYKIDIPGYKVYITPTYKSAKKIIQAGADIVALDATPRKRPGGETFAGIVEKIHNNHKISVMADISTVKEGIHAEMVGADIISTTLSGYTPYSRQLQGPDFILIKELVRKVKIPVIAEGRIWAPEEARKALDWGAYAVVIGTAITRPIMITKRFIKAMQGN